VSTVVPATTLGYVQVGDATFKGSHDAQGTPKTAFALLVNGGEVVFRNVSV
jgi:hypothetical protein